MDSLLLSRRALVSVLLVGGSGCVGGTDQEQTNGAVINTTERVEPTRPDGTRSTLGYIEFIEKPQYDAVVIRQTLVGTSIDCGRHELVTTSDLPENTITVDTKTLENSPAKVCDRDLRPGTGIEIVFAELREGYDIEFTHGDLSVGYETVGEPNKTVKEPRSVPDNIRI